MNRRGIRSILAALATLVVSLSFTVTADAAPKRPPTTTQPVYVALGDSYAAGVGAGSYLSGTCYRSLKGYPGLIAAEKGYALDLQACSGATTADVISLQIPSKKLNSTTKYVTITVGGNDVGFSSVVSTCLGTSESACQTAVQGAVSKAENELPAKLSAVFAAAKKKAPNATIVATSYPQLLSPATPNCYPFTNFTAGEVTALNAGAVSLAGVIERAAATAAIEYSDVSTAFVGHAVCDSPAWIHNASLLSSYQSFHPNASGYLEGYKPGVVAELGGTSTGTTITVTTGGLTSSDTTRGNVKIPKSQKD
ncbi:SGNH/GDSL hydrolase family protein [Tessaracoccus sp. Y1736]